VYVAAAWLVPPGFYDGITPPTPYPFVCPPPQAGAAAAPASGHTVIKVTNGQSEAASAFTNDGVVAIGFVSGSFDVAGNTSVTVDITPVSPCPDPSGLRFVTNTYHVVASAPLIKPATLVMQYSNVEPDPSYVYRAASVDGPWINIGASSQARLWTINVKTHQFGYLAAGFPAGSLSPGGSVPWLPIVVAALISVVLLAGLPAVVARRRRK
jgi:hypothetical protein